MLVALAALTAAAASTARSTGVAARDADRRLRRRRDPGRRQRGRDPRQGIDLDLEVAPCRRSRARAARTTACARRTSSSSSSRWARSSARHVVVAVGYNDFEDQYAGNIEDAIDALNAAGVKQVCWLTLRAAHHPYLYMNDDIAQAAAKHPAADRGRLERVLAEPSGLVPDRRPAPARPRRGGDGDADPQVAARRRRRREARRASRRRRCRSRAAARRTARSSPRPQGVAPYRWSLLERAPARDPSRGERRGHRHAAREARRVPFNVRVRDAIGSLATRRFTLRIRRVTSHACSSRPSPSRSSS